MDQNSRVENSFSSRESYLTEENENEHFVYGTAISADDILRVRKGGFLGPGSVFHLRFTREALLNAAKSLEGKELVLDHINNSVDSTVGQVTEAKYEDGDVKYKAKVIEQGHEGLLSKIKAGILETSIRAFHRPIGQLEHDEENNVYKINDTELDNLSIVNRGEASSADINYGDTQLAETDMLSSLEHNENTEVIAASQSLPKTTQNLQSERVTVGNAEDTVSLQEITETNDGTSDQRKSASEAEETEDANEEAETDTETREISESPRRTLNKL